MSTKSTSRKILTVIVLLCCAQFANCGAGSRRKMEQEEKDKQRYKQPFAIIFFSVFLAIALPLWRFIVCVWSDPLVPPMLRELKRRASKMFDEKFGTLGVVDKKEIGVELDDVYAEMRNID